LISYPRSTNNLFLFLWRFLIFFAIPPKQNTAGGWEHTKAKREDNPNPWGKRKYIDSSGFFLPLDSKKKPLYF